jgi:hypothetical protein
MARFHPQLCLLGHRADYLRRPIIWKVINRYESPAVHDDFNGLDPFQRFASQGNSRKRNETVVVASFPTAGGIGASSEEYRYQQDEKNLPNNRYPSK